VSSATRASGFEIGAVIAIRFANTETVEQQS
jgi:hypothetical protein